MTAWQGNSLDLFFPPCIVAGLIEKPAQKSANPLAPSVRKIDSRIKQIRFSIGPMQVTIVAKNFANEGNGSWPNPPIFTVFTTIIPTGALKQSLKLHTTRRCLSEERYMRAIS